MYYAFIIHVWCEICIFVTLFPQVIIVAHVPPGVFEKHPSKYWFYPKFNTRFVELLRDHADTIGSMHFAHHHTDSFRMVYSDSRGRYLSEVQVVMLNTYAAIHNRK